MDFKSSAKGIKWRSAGELREMFLSYFEEKGSRRYPSFSLVPDDPTLLFTVAGMVPFKPYFLGLKAPEVTRATTAQKCIRTNDIDNVGHTARHHTFFEMLGNFSFGDYFKKEVIPWAWEFVTERVGLDPDKLYATIYLDDDEAHDFWRDLVGLPEERIVRFGDEDNFWAAGPTGPCGPCSELLYDQGPDFSCGKPDCGLGCSCDRYLEIWNLVFMQYSRDESGKLSPLPKKNIDTGMGLERLASIVQGVKGDFETDLFKPIMDKACGIAGFEYGDSPKGDLAVRVISDHLRASAFMIADGVLPSNEGPGYVLRRLIRRSVRYGRLIGLEKPFLLELLPAVNEIMSGQYGELIEQSSTIRQILEMEETRFGHTLSQGMELLEGELKKVAASVEGGKRGTLPGEVAFALYDTYGFPLELTEEISSEANVDVCRDGFNKEMERQRERARSSSKQSAAVMSANAYTRLADRLGPTRFDGYESTRADAIVTAIISNDAETDSLSEGEPGMIILSNTPFYAERGGQAGDRGVLEGPGARFEVEDTAYPSGEMIAHAGRISNGTIKIGMMLEATVDSDRRDATRRHHTATHLLHEALIRVLGSHVRQAGSLVTPAFLRFDFNHFGPLSESEIRQVERIVYGQVLRAVPVKTSVMNYDDARKLGVKALFEEKYGDVVRVLDIPGFSTELCGGTHVGNTGEIGLVKIVKDEGIGSGVRRLVALAGTASLDLVLDAFSSLSRVSDILGGLGGNSESLPERVENLLAEKKLLERKNQELLLRNASEGVSGRLADAKKIGGVTLVVDSLQDTPRDLLRQIGDRIKQAEPSAVILLASVEDGSVTLVGMASDNAVKSGVHAGNLVREVSALMGGSGGGKPATGQGGSKDPSKLQEALAAAPRIVTEQIGARQ